MAPSCFSLSRGCRSFTGFLCSSVLVLALSLSVLVIPRVQQTKLASSVLNFLTHADRLY